MSSTETPEAKELSLVGKVEMRIAVAPNDSSLEKTLNIYLAPLLLKLASEYVSVRNKVSNLPSIVIDRLGVTIAFSALGTICVLIMSPSGYISMPTCQYEDQTTVCNRHLLS